MDHWSWQTGLMAVITAWVKLYHLESEPAPPGFLSPPLSAIVPDVHTHDQA